MAKRVGARPKPGSELCRVEEGITPTSTRPPRGRTAFGSIVYPWYRAGYETSTPLSPKFQLLADPVTADWHEFGMEWKEHIAWIAPILATVVAFIVLYYGANLIRHDRVRKTAMALFLMAFGFAAVAGAIGAFITKLAPVR